jgi:hypothetical protein
MTKRRPLAERKRDRLRFESLLTQRWKLENYAQPARPRVPEHVKRERIETELSLVRERLAYDKICELEHEIEELRAARNGHGSKQRQAARLRAGEGVEDPLTPFNADAVTA